MESIASCLKPCLSRACDASLRQIGYLYKAKTIIKQLAEAMEDLKAKREDIRSEIEAADGHGQQPTRQVQRWLEKVSEIEGEVQRWLDKISATKRDDIRLDNEAAVREQRQRTQEIRRWLDCEGSGCNLFRARIPNCWWSYRTGRQASKLLAKVMALETEKAGFVNILMPQPLVGVQEINTGTSTQGGTMMASYLEKVRRYLEEEEDKYLIGIWGMGGVGKTTLLKEINNVYLHCSAATDTKFFDIVIFVVVSKDHSLEKLQKDIINRLRLNSSDDVESQATVIFNFLKEKNFLLLLDDAWESLNLRAIGIPDRAGASNKTDRRRRHKVVITTRSEQVCGEMDSCKKIRVECLEEEEAWNLFKEKVGKDLLDSHPDLVSPAQEVTKECDGLPLALVVIGRAMSTKRNSNAWNYTLTQLRKSQASNIQGIDNYMFPILKYSYDNLQDDKMRGCFLCCSLWPEDEEIFKEQLILAWMGLGLIDDFDDINEAYDLGHSIIESLLAASLLEPVVQDVDGRVKMHDVIRDLALWIACDCGKERNRWLVKANANLTQVPSDMAAKWGEAERISLMHNLIEELPRNLPAAYCPNLSVLMLQHNNLEEIPIGFLQGMPNLTYLDLSWNPSLREIPNEIGCLVKLRYLNLSSTRISSLPDELGQLPNLKYLLLRFPCTDGPVSIPNKVLSSLSKKLEFLDLFPHELVCSYDDDHFDELTLISLLSGLKAVSVKIKSFKILQQLSHHQVPIIRLRMEDTGDADSPSSFHLRDDQFNSVTRGCLRELDLWGCHSLSEVVMDINGTTLPRLEMLVFWELKKMRQIVWGTNVVPSECFGRLRSLTIRECPLLRNITWILHLPLLEDLEVSNCEAMEQLIVDGATASAEEEEEEAPLPRITSTVTFPRLKLLYLEKLPRLCDICSSSDYALLNFPSLECVQVLSCPELKKLPFRPQVNCRKLREVACSAIWWDSIEWEDEGIKSSFEESLIYISA